MIKYKYYMIVSKFSLLGISGRAEGTITWLVHVNDTLVPAFTLDAQLDLCVNLSVQLGGKSEIYLDLITVEPYIQLRSSNIGNFSIRSLQTFLKIYRWIIKDFANRNLKHGIPLPAIDHVNFSGFDFQLNDVSWNKTDALNKSI